MQEGFSGEGSGGDGGGGGESAAGAPNAAASPTGRSDGLHEHKAVTEHKAGHTHEHMFAVAHQLRHGSGLIIAAGAISRELPPSMAFHGLLRPPVAFHGLPRPPPRAFHNLLLTSFVTARTCLHRRSSHTHPPPLLTTPWLTRVHPSPVPRGSYHADGE